MRRRINSSWKMKLKNRLGGSYNNTSISIRLLLVTNVSSHNESEECDALAAIWVHEVQRALEGNERSQMDLVPFP